MNIEIESCKLILNLIDKETGEIISKEATLGDFKEVVKKTSTTRARKPKDTDPVAKITLLDNKWQMNNAAVEMTGFEPDSKLEIKFEKKGRQITPVLCEDEKSGNRLTKTYTVSCRGSKRDNLLEFGTIFEVLPYEGREGYFKLKGDAPEKEDDIIDVPEEIVSPEDDIVDVDDVTSSDDIDFDLDL